MKNSNSRRIAPTRSPFHVIYSSFHEAGHAIAALVLGIRIVRVSVMSSRNALGSCRVILPDGYDYDEQRQQRAMARSCIVMTYAGLIAENMVNPSIGKEAALDEILAHDLALNYDVFGEPVTPANERAYFKVMEGLRREAVQLVARYRNGVALFSAALVRRKKILGGEAESWARDNYLPVAYTPPVDLASVGAVNRRLLENSRGP